MQGKMCNCVHLQQEMNYPLSAVETLLKEIRLKAPKVQTLIGAGAGLIAAIVIIKIAESVAIFLGAAMLALSLTTDIVFIPNVNLKFNFNFVNGVIRRNGPLANGFIAGFLIGFAMI